MIVSPAHISKKDIITTLDLKNANDNTRLKDDTEDIDLRKTYLMTMQYMKLELDDSNNLYEKILKKL